MLSREQNEQLVQVGAGTPMGDLLRRYWHPIAPTAELDETPVKPIEVLGEKLVLYKDRSGTYGLVSRRCPHRGFDLAYGFVESCGLRCSYHGWRFDQHGACVEQPYEDVADPSSRFKDRVRITAYPVQAFAGLLWAYLGPAPAPLIPNWEPFTWENGFVHVFFAELPCNWVQCQENSIDPVHFEWLHLRWSRAQAGDESAPLPPRHLKLTFEEFPYGFRYGRIVEGFTEEDESWRIGRTCLFPNVFYTGSVFSWRVPIDDRRTLSVHWEFQAVPRDRVPYRQDRVPYSYIPITDDAGRLITTDVIHQDMTAWVLQGEIADRTVERLGRSDEGIIMMRRKLLQQAEAVARGESPFALVRDPEQNRCIELPIIDRDALRGLAPRSGDFDASQRAAMRGRLVAGLSEETLAMRAKIVDPP